MSAKELLETRVEMPREPSSGWRQGRVSRTEPVPSLGLTGVRCGGCRQCGQGQAEPQEDAAREAAGNEVLGALGSQTEKEGVVCC